MKLGDILFFFLKNNRKSMDGSRGGGGGGGKGLNPLVNNKLLYVSLVILELTPLEKQLNIIKIFLNVHSVSKMYAKITV